MEINTYKKQDTALDLYLNKVFTFMVITPTTVALFSAISYTVSYIRGTYRSVSFAGLVAFDVLNLLYMAAAIYFLFKGNKNGTIDMRRFGIHKIAVAMCIILQWNFTAYLIPARDFWAWSPFFALFGVFFFDTKLMKFIIAGLSVSTLTAYVLKPMLFVPRDSQYYSSDVMFRFTHLALSMFFIYAITNFGEKYLIEELEKYANFDPLTGLLNRRSLEPYMQTSIKNAEKNGDPFSVILFDIDDFKKINDTYGHDCGDEILKIVSRQIATGVNSEDRVFRWGGEEIFVVLKADMEHAMQIAERIRSDIERNTVKYREFGPLSVTVTAGVSSYEKGMTMQKMFDDTDGKLYYGKEHGKNRTVGSF